MFSSRATGKLCPLCEMRTIFSSLRPQARNPSWQFSRGASQLQRKRPQRMMLAPSVSRPPPKYSESGTPIKRRSGNSPFGGMNRTAIPEDLEAQRRKRIQAVAGRPPRTSISPKQTSRPRKSSRAPGEMRALKMQQALSTVPYGHRTAVKSRIGEWDTFEQFPLMPPVLQSIKEDVLGSLAELTPTPIQRLALPALLGLEKKIRRSADPDTPTRRIQEFLLAAETGSGKTLAYAVPVIDALKRTEAVETAAEEQEQTEKVEKKRTNLFELDPPPLSNDSHESSGRPRAIILVPTSELVEQTGAVFKRFSHIAKLRVSLISAHYSAAVIRNRLFGPAGIDVLISTPHLVHSIAQSDPNILSRVTHLVIDEADSLLDRSFSPLTSAVIDRATPSLKQLILCSATIPRSLNIYLEKRFPGLTRLATPNLHAIPRRVQLSIVDIDAEPFRGNRDLACADAIWTIGRDVASDDNFNDTGHPNSDSRSPASLPPVKHIIVFVNEREKAPELAAYLVGKGIDAVALNRDTTEQRRGDTLSAFTSLDPVPVVGKPSAEPVTIEDRRSAFATRLPDTRARRQQPQRRLLGNVKVLVMTDIGARGIDTVAVRNVVLYDVPHTSIDFIHRLGRVGRMGRRGRGFVLVGRNDRKDVVKEIREGMFRGQALI